jgi:hypothetical protein
MSRIARCSYAWLAVVTLAACSKSAEPETGAPPETGAAPGYGAAPGEAAAPSAAAAGTAGSLTDVLTSTLGVSPAQAEAGVGVILAYAQGKLPAADYNKVAATVPGAPATVQAAKDAGAVTGPIDGPAGVTSALGRLGISPEGAANFVPVVTQQLGKTGGPEVQQLLAGLFP